LSRSVLRINCIRALLYQKYSNVAPEAVGFIGLGNMGCSMAANLAKKGHKVFAYDLMPESGKKLLSLVGSSGELKLLSSVSEVASSPVKHIVTMLPNSPQVETVYLDENHGLLKAAHKGTLMMDCTTGEPVVCQKVAEQAKQLGLHYIDSPVSGGVVAAMNGGLTFMVGGSQDLLKRAEPFLLKMGKMVIHCGESVGMGEAAKICNNMLLAISMIGTSEAMALGQRLGLDPKLLASVLNSSSGRCWSSEVYNPVPGVVEGVPSERDYQGGFGSSLMLKDLNLAMSACLQTQTASPLGSTSLNIYRLLIEHGFGSNDFSVVYKFLNKM
jgi:3-hydroxyisobutyrate dehydrogenase